MKKSIKIMMMVLSLSIMYQFAIAQGCPGTKVRMASGSRGHGCNCKQKCVDAAEVPTYQATGWYIGECLKFCAIGFRSGDESNASLETSLTEIYPNPASGSVTVGFNLVQQGEVTLDVFDVTGRYVTTIAQNVFDAESNEVTWDASEVNPGIYFISMETQIYRAMKKVSIIK